MAVAMLFLPFLTLLFAALHLEQVTATGEHQPSQTEWRKWLDGVDLPFLGHDTDPEAMVNQVQLTCYLECLEEWFEGRETARNRKKKRRKWAKHEGTCYQMVQDVVVKGKRAPFTTNRILKSPSTRQELRKLSPLYRKPQEPQEDNQEQKGNAFLGDKDISNFFHGRDRNTGNLFMQSVNQVKDQLWHYFGLREGHSAERGDQRGTRPLHSPLQFLHKPLGVRL